MLLRYPNVWTKGFRVQMYGAGIRLNMRLLKYSLTTLIYKSPFARSTKFTNISIQRINSKYKLNV